MATNTQTNFSTTVYTGLGLTSLSGSNNITIGNTFQNSSDCGIFRSPTDEATLDVKGRIKMNGEYLDERLERIEALLEIPTRDLEMEREFPKLRELWNAYTEELEKYKTWKRLKDSK